MIIQFFVFWEFLNSNLIDYFGDELFKFNFFESFWIFDFGIDFWFLMPTTYQYQYDTNDTVNEHVDDLRNTNITFISTYYTRTQDNRTHPRE
jgi:hypothetical protein